MKKILLTGGSSLLSTNWVLCNNKKYEVILGLNKTKVNFPKTKSIFLNFENKDKLLNQVSKINPDIIVHTAGLTNVDECEENLNLSYKLNSQLAENIAQICYNLNIKLTHISTDHLFDGKKSFYDESNIACPINNYGKSKLEGERLVQIQNPHALIIRTNFFGWGNKKKHSFSDWIINSLQNKKNINVFNDIFFTPILIDELVKCINLLWMNNCHGIFNVVGKERISKYGFALLTAKTFKLNSELIIENSIINSNFRAKRPLDMSLNSKKFSDLTGYKPLSIELSLNGLYSQLIDNRKKIIDEAFI